MWVSLNKLRVVLIVALSARAGICAQDRRPSPVTEAPLARTWVARDYGGGPINLAVAQHPKTGLVYVGNGRGLLEFDGALWRMIPLPDHGPARALAIDADGAIWICSYNEIVRLQPDATGEWRAVSVLDQAPASARSVEFLNQALVTPLGLCFTERNHVLLFPPQERARVWRSEQPLQRVWWMDGALHVTVVGRGVVRLQGGGPLTAVPVEVTAGPALDLTQLKVFEAREVGAGRTLLATARGPAVWDARGRTVRLLAAGAAFFATEEASAGALLSGGRMAFASERNDFAIFNDDGVVLKHSSGHPALASGRAQAIAEDREGGIWVAKVSGVARLQFNHVAVADAAGGGAPVVFVRRVVAAPDRVVFSGFGGDPPAAPALMPEHSTLRFELAAPTFRMDVRGRAGAEFRTKLDGRDRDWTPWTTEARREFTGLAAKSYVFRAQARDLAGGTGPEVALAFARPHQWWLTPWAWAAYTLGGLALMGAGHLLGGIVQRRRARQLEAVVAARTEELTRSNAELARLRQLDLDEKVAARLGEEKARLEVLRYQLNPHFLYNALNSVYSLVLTAPPAAASMVLRLADFCRVALERQTEDITTVGAEFDKLTTYLAIEKVRWGDSLVISVVADEAVRRATIPPFLLLPLVENAIKYGGATSPDQLQVRVSAAIDPDQALRFEVANSGTWIGPGTPAMVSSSGIGLANLRQRLQRHYPGAHVLAIEHGAGWVRVALKLAANPLPIAATVVNRDAKLEFHI
ncbi:MAG: histidine kinase [Verrucomicrobia bacterium]|nr:histidine kinase [Verrucomicrobiota bacterium]